MRTRIFSIVCGFLLVTNLSTAQSKIHGTVTDENNDPIFGAKVQLENTYLGAYSDPKGIYSISNVPDGDFEILIKYSGYEIVRKNISLSGKDVELSVQMVPTVQNLLEVLVIETRANEKTPTTYTNLNSKEIDKQNFGQDLPMLLRFTPSTVVTSDAGAGVGYTGIRIRGVDPTRTNVTVNGIPLNDSESHGVFWVNMPDFASSVDKIQVQRGVGTSANGAAAFGASVNINTNRARNKAYGEIDNGYGSFKTWRHAIKAGTGLINNKFSVNTRLSKITSDGYVDRASSNLKSFYLDASWVGNKSSLTGNIFSGREKTYQAWYGTPESVVKGDADEINAYADRNWVFGEERDRLLNSGRTYNFYTYENEVDNYQQDHYQLHFSHRINSRMKLNVKGHYTRGRGYYEQYRVNDDFSTYGFAPVIFTNDTVTTTDLIRRRWLDNHFYGGIFSLNYKRNGFDLTFGGGANQYVGDHFGEVIWAEYASQSEIRDRYYDNQGNKFEAQSYVKGTYRRGGLTYFLDLQYRHVDYEFLGVDDVSGNLEEVTQSASYDFINPKAGIMLDLNSRNNFYLSIAMANREPVRADFRENTPENRPAHEQLLNLEAGYRYKGRRLMANANVYFMNYTDQLVLTGQINDVGGYTRTNVESSYRAGIELEMGYMILENLSVTANTTFSQNKISEFTEYVFNYDTYVEDQFIHTNADLAYSPNLIAAIGLQYNPIENLNVGITSKYVSDQYLDNTSSDERKLDAYFFSNLNISYTVKDFLFSEIKIGIQVNNLFNEMYENNGYTWGYISGGSRTTENFLYPQAGRNFMTRITIKL